jgi:transposase-like protein
MLSTRRNKTAATKVFARRVGLIGRPRRSVIDRSGANTARLEAARCALREAASFMTVFFPVPSEASHTIIRAKIPFSHHRFHRLLAKRDSCPK